MLNWQLKLANLRQLTIFQELLFFEALDRKEERLQKKLGTCVKEENRLMVGTSLRPGGPTDADDVDRTRDVCVVVQLSPSLTGVAGGV